MINANWQKEHEVKTLAAVFKIGIKTCIFIIMVWRKEVEILPSFTAGTNSCNWPSITRLSSAKKKNYELRWHLFDATFVAIEEN